MNAPDQFYVFLVAASCGAAGGLIYDAVCLLRTPAAPRFVVAATDVVCGALFAALWLAVFSGLGLPGLRAFHLLAALAGFALYRKSPHKIVAFFGKKLYNGVNQLRRGRKKCPEEGVKVKTKKK